jgi:hypothetical protein
LERSRRPRHRQQRSLYQQKVDFLTKNNVAIFRMHDHMHDQRPDFLYVGSARELGLDPKYQLHPIRTASRSRRRHSAGWRRP